MSPQFACVKCATPLPEGSAFCNRCGAAQPESAAGDAVTAVSSATVAPSATSSSPSPGASSSSRAAVGATAGDEERTLWIGRPSAKSLAMGWLLFVIYAVAVLWATYGWLKPTSPTVEGALVGAALLPAVWLGFKTLVLKLSTRYRLTSQRLFKEVGIVSRTISEIELIRIDDVAVKRTLTDRMFGLGTVTLVSSDRDEPRLELVGVDAPIDVKERIRECVQQRRARVLNVERI